MAESAVTGSVGRVWFDMFGLSFLNSVFLAGLAAAALPILIHLFSRRRAREVSFPSLEYLREISRQKVRRMRLRQWLLLALRVLIVALFALAMGRPAIRGSKGALTRGSSTIAVVLDNSASMSAADPALSSANPVLAPVAGSSEGNEALPPEAGSLFAAAKKRASEIFDLMGEGDRGILVLSGRPIGLPFQTPVADAGLLRQEVKRSALAADEADLPSALEAVVPQLASARTINRELFVVSDFQRKDIDAWIHAATSGGSTSAGGDSTHGSGSMSIPAGIKVYLVPVTEKSQPNVSIERVRYDGSGGIGAAGRVIATVVNQGDDPVADRVARVTAASGGSSLADALFSLPPHGQDDVTMDLSQLPPDGALQVTLGSDPMEWDNTAWLVTGQPGVHRVLLVCGPEGSASAELKRAGTNLAAAGAATGDLASLDPPESGLPAGGAVSDSAAAAKFATSGSTFLRLALDPGGNSEFFRVREADPNALSDPSVWDADVVILSDVGRLSDAAVENLVRFKARGGGILIGLGDHVDPRSYNTQILAKICSVELLDISRAEEAGAYRSLRPTVASHPIFAGFPIGPGEDLGSARFHKIMTTRVGSGARVLAEFGRDVPALIEENGVLLFTSSLDGEWNDFVTSASFPPFLHQMVRYLVGRGAGDERSGHVGARLETLVPEGAFQGSLTALDSQGGRSAVEAIPVERMIRLRSQPAMLPGIYRFQDGSGKVVASFAVNLDSKEGDLTVASPQSELRLLGRAARRLEPGATVTRELLQGRYGRELWRPILVLVLILLVVESVLGRGKLLG